MRVRLARPCAKPSHFSRAVDIGLKPQRPRSNKPRRQPHSVLRRCASISASLGRRYPRRRDRPRWFCAWRQGSPASNQSGPTSTAAGLSRNRVAAAPFGFELIRVSAAHDDARRRKISSSEEITLHGLPFAAAIEPTGFAGRGCAPRPPFGRHLFSGWPRLGDHARILIALINYFRLNTTSFFFPAPPVSPSFRTTTARPAGDSHCKPPAIDRTGCPCAPVLRTRSGVADDVDPPGDYLLTNPLSNRRDPNLARHRYLPDDVRAAHRGIGRRLPSSPPPASGGARQRRPTSVRIFESFQGMPRSGGANREPRGCLKQTLPTLQSPPESKSPSPARRASGPPASFFRFFPASRPGDLAIEPLPSKRKSRCVHRGGSQHSQPLIGARCGFARRQNPDRRPPALSCRAAKPLIRQMGLMGQASNPCGYEGPHQGNKTGPARCIGLYKQDYSGNF